MAGAAWLLGAIAFAFALQGAVYAAYLRAHSGLAPGSTLVWTGMGTPPGRFRWTAALWTPTEPPHMHLTVTIARADGAALVPWAMSAEAWPLPPCVLTCGTEAADVCTPTGVTMHRTWRSASGSAGDAKAETCWAVVSAAMPKWLVVAGLDAPPSQTIAFKLK